MEWISIKDKKPANGEKLLFYNDEMDIIDIGYFEDNQFICNKFITYNSEYWMYLPDIPNKRKK